MTLVIYFCVSLPTSIHLPKSLSMFLAKPSQSSGFSHSLTARVKLLFFRLMPRTHLALLSFFLLSLQVATAGLIWRPGEGWSDENGSAVSASSSSDQLELAHNLEAKGQRDAALAAYKTLVRRWPLALAAPEANFKVGKILEDEADFQNAFKAFQKLVDKFPYSPYFTQALDEQFRIANLYLDGEPQRIWKIPMGPSMEKTIGFYNQVIKNAPYGPDAPQAQFNIGRAREKQDHFLDAVDAYQTLIDKYPNSDLASNAQYQIGYAWMKSATKPDYDQSAAQKAIDAFQDFIVKYPDSDKGAQAQENINKLSHKRTQGAFNIAKFYETQHNPRAAYIYYNEVLKEDPTGDSAAYAKKRIQELRPVVEALPGGLDPAASAAVVANNQAATAAASTASAQNTNTGTTGQNPPPPLDNTPPPPSTDPADTSLPKDPLQTPGAAASSPASPTMPAGGANPDNAALPAVPVGPTDLHSPGAVSNPSTPTADNSSSSAPSLPAQPVVIPGPNATLP